MALSKGRCLNESPHRNERFVHWFNGRQGPSGPLNRKLKVFQYLLALLTLRRNDLPSRRG